MMMSESEDKEDKVPQSFQLASLPDELALGCISRVSRSDYAALSLVSKKYNSLLVSPELYNMRSLLGCTEKCLYITLSDSTTTSWYILSREKTLIPIPSFPSQPPKESSLVALDWGIYVIGGWRKYRSRAVSDVMLLDCRTHTWHLVPSMRVARTRPAVGVVGGKIYVIGGCAARDNWGEVFDPKTQTWDHLVPLPDRSKYDFVMSSMVMDDKVYTLSKRGLVYYSPNESRWVRMKKREGVFTYPCGTRKLLYCCSRYGDVFWSESEALGWKVVKGLEALRGYQEKYDIKLLNFGRNIMLMWYVYTDPSHKYVDIWCNEISFERSEDKREVWGTIVWSQAVASKLPCYSYSQGVFPVI